jgi:putative membrane protein
MPIIADIVIGVVALIHLYILVLEMFLWDKPIGLKAFGMSKEVAASSKVLAANQGLYNGFLAAGLLWGLILSNTGLGDAGQDGTGYAIKAFFLCCIIVAGLFGAATASRKILWIQALPATLALFLLVCG